MDDESDLLYGAKAIASFLRIRPRQAYHLLAQGTFPAFKVGGKVCARRSSLTAWLADCEAKARPAPAEPAPE